MARCETCGNDYDHSFEIIHHGRTHTFDCFECAIFMMAPSCGNCGCRILGHGVQTDEQTFCSAHCARQCGVQGLADHVGDRSGIEIVR